MNQPQRWLPVFPNRTVVMLRFLVFNALHGWVGHVLKSLDLVLFIMALLKNMLESNSSKVNVTLIDTHIDNNCHFCDSSENIIPDSCEDIMRNTII